MDVYVYTHFAPLDLKNKAYRYSSIGGRGRDAEGHRHNLTDRATKKGGRHAARECYFVMSESQKTLRSLKTQKEEGFWRMYTRIHSSANC